MRATPHDLEKVPPTLVCDRFSRIPEGWFVMGRGDGDEGERPAHRVWVDAFEMAVHPVTRGDYASFLDATGHSAPRDWQDEAFSDAQQPVVGVSWHDAVAYARWRSTVDPGVRLPSEAEWERAARGGVEGTRYAWGNDLPDWLPNGGRGPLTGPWRVTLGPPNPFGILGIGANVHEWCADWYDPTYYAHSPERNPRGPAQGRRRASRGGSWRHAITISTNAARSRLDPAFRYTDYGFRLAREVRA